MEKYPKKFTKEEKNLYDMADWFSRNALGNILELDTTPTSETMKANQLYYYNSKLYYKTAKGTAFEISVTTL
jgi:hypothetical protein